MNATTYSYNFEMFDIRAIVKPRRALYEDMRSGWQEEFYVRENHMGIGSITRSYAAASQINRRTEKKEEKSEDFRAFLQDKTEEMHEKIKNGDIEPRYQIGAQEFSEKEWDKLLERFDKTEEELREQMRQEHEKRKEEAEEEALEKKNKDVAIQN